MLFLLSDNPCTDPDVIKTIFFIKELLNILFVLVPIGLVIMVSLDFAKNVVAGREDDMRKNVGIAIKRIVFCAALFFVMPLVSFFMGLLDEADVLKGWGDSEVDWTTCYTLATKKNITEINKYDDSRAKFILENYSKGNTKEKAVKEQTKELKNNLKTQDKYFYKVIEQYIKDAGITKTEDKQAAYTTAINYYNKNKTKITACQKKKTEKEIIECIEEKTANDFLDTTIMSIKK